MTKTVSIFIVGLFVLFIATAGSAFAYGSSSLNGTTWVGTNVTLITTGGTVTTTNTLSIGPFTASTTDHDLLSGTLTFTPSGSSPIPFSAIQDEESLSIVAVGSGFSYIIHAHIIHQHHHGGRNNQPATMFIKGTSLLDGSQFEGTLTEQ